VAPNAEFILWGAEDTAQARIHASDESVDPDESADPDESVDPDEIAAMILAQVYLIQDLAKARRDQSSPGLPREPDAARRSPSAG